MKKIIDNFGKFLLIVCLIFVTACGNEETNAVNGQNGNSIISVWKSANEQDVLSFAKDGTYKMILYKSEKSYYITKVSHFYKHIQMSDYQRTVKTLISIRQNAYFFHTRRILSINRL